MLVIMKVKPALASMGIAAKVKHKNGVQRAIADRQCVKI
jgi:hypothetical protein